MHDLATYVPHSVRSVTEAVSTLQKQPPPSCTRTTAGSRPHPTWVRRESRTVPRLGRPYHPLWRRSAHCKCMHPVQGVYTPPVRSMRQQCTVRRRPHTDQYRLHFPARVHLQANEAGGPHVPLTLPVRPGAVRPDAAQACRLTRG